MTCVWDRITDSMSEADCEALAPMLNEVAAYMTTVNEWIMDPINPAKHRATHEAHVQLGKVIGQLFIEEVS